MRRFRTLALPFLLMSQVSSPSAVIAPGLFVAVVSMQGCSHKKVKPPLTQKNLRDKKVALVDVNGAKEARLQTEIAIVNDIISQGRFQIIDRASVQSALEAHPTEADWKSLGLKLGADLLLAVDILEFKADTRKGYDSVEERDSLLSAEHRTSRDTKWKHYYKVKAREGFVNVRLRFFDVSAGTIIFDKTGEATKVYNSRDGDLPRQMRLLEELTQQAVSAFFEGLPED